MYKYGDLNMRKFKKAKYNDELLGKEVTIITRDAAAQRGFEVNKVYTGKLLSKKDWMIGCPVFECSNGILGLGYECDLVDRVD